MKKLKLMTKVYSSKKRVYSHIQSEIEEQIKDLNVTITSTILDDDGYITIALEGEDEIAASNYIASLFGESKKFGELKEGDIIKGYICSSGKIGFGIFVDIGIKNPYQIDVLIPLFILRKQLVDDKKIPVRKLIDLFGLIDNFPLEVLLEKVSIGTKKIEGRLSDKQAETFQRWVEDGLEKLFILGTSKETVQEVLKDTKHSKDIIEIETVGWMENVLTCKFNTNAKGLIPRIGKILPRAKFEIFSPAQINKALKD